MVTRIISFRQLVCLETHPTKLPLQKGDSYSVNVGWHLAMALMAVRVGAHRDLIRSRRLQASDIAIGHR